MAYHFGRIHKKPHNLVPKWHFNSSRRQITGSCSSSSETEVAASTSDFRYVGFAQMKEKVGWNPVRVCIIWTTCYWFSIMVTLIRWSIINCFESKDVMRLSQLVNQQKGLSFFLLFFFSIWSDCWVSRCSVRTRTFCSQFLDDLALSKLLWRKSERVTWSSRAWP